MYLLPLCLLLVAALASVLAFDGGPLGDKPASTCSWGYKPTKEQLQDTPPKVLTADYDPVFQETVWSTPSVGGPSPLDLVVRQSQGDIRVDRAFQSGAAPTFVFAFKLTGVLPPEAKAKGAKGNTWNMFLYYKQTSDGQCLIPQFVPKIESISVQQLK